MAEAAADDVRAILARAEERGRTQALPYAGAVTPEEAWKLVESGAAQLVDVRTTFEREYVGRPPKGEAIEWRRFGGLNENFLEELATLGDKGGFYVFLCRSGVRSHAAAQAATGVGYTHAYNILEGFEGDLDEHKHRGNLGGWRKAGLPWIQG